ncbi:hypothetical protein BKA64DRAFT_702511 [Cadophora sp. MPI-SDFR-AT-0126]|nr:hypothetical protein BKA64DRAFT_702511 [Leotiomycetes sp. MPI-SDFR-AT-0126]
MRLTFLAVLTCLVAWVAADGLRNGYERVWLWYAYQLDLERPEAERKIGYKCMQWTQKAKGVAGFCPEKYKPKKGPETSNVQPCKGKRPDKSCYFWEFMSHIDSKQFDPKRMWLLPTDINNPNLDDQKNLKPDVSDTAHWLSVQHGTEEPMTSNNPMRAVKYPPYRVFQGVGDDYDKMLTSLGKHSADGISKLTPAQKTAHKDDIDAIVSSLKGVVIERKIDHSKFLFAAADAKGFKLEVSTEPGFNGEFVDWEKTQSVQGAAAVEAFRADYYDFVYDGDEQALKDKAEESKKGRDHLKVMEAFKEVQDGYSACSIGGF